GAGLQAPSDGRGQRARAPEVAPRAPRGDAADHEGKARSGPLAACLLRRVRRAASEKTHRQGARILNKVVFLVFVCLCACSGSTPAATTAHGRKPNHAEIDRFVADEDRILSVMAAADARVAARGIAADKASLQH